MNKGATQQGVPEDPRAAIFSKIEESRVESLKEEGIESLEPPEDWEEDEGVQPEAKEEPREELKEETPEETSQETQPPAEQMLRVKVDGVEMEKPLSWVLAQAQKNAAADRRLEEASKAKALYEARLAEVESLKPKEPEKPKKPSLPADLADALKGLARRQLETTDEGEYAEIEAEKAEVYREVARREWAARDQMQREAYAMQQRKSATERLLEEVSKAHTDFREIAVADDFKSWLSEQTTGVRWAWDQSLDPRDGIEILNRYKAFKNPTQSLEAKRDAKRNLDTVRTASARAVAPKEEDDEDDSPSSYVKKLQEMRNPRRATAR